MVAHAQPLDRAQEKNRVIMVAAQTAALYRRFLMPALSFIFCLGSGSAILAQGRRPLTPDDLFQIRRIGNASVSPDGKTVAYVLQRPYISARVYQQYLLFGGDRSDIWLTPVVGGSPQRITNGEADHSGYWCPRWSPDGQHLAMLSTKGNDNVRLWVWEKASQKLIKLSESGVLLGRLGPSVEWLDNRRLVAFLLPKGEQPWLMRWGRQESLTAMGAWPRAWAGRETTASVLDSGVPAELESRPQLELAILDITGREQLLTSITDWVSRVDIPLYVAPDRQHIAFPKLISLQRPDPAKVLQNSSRLGDSGARYQMSIAEASGRISLPATRGVRFVALDSFRWSRDGKSYAFVAVKEGNSEDSLDVFYSDIRGSLEVVPLAGCDPRSLTWASKKRLLVSAECSVGGDGPKRLNWYVVTAGGMPRNITEKLNTVPYDLVSDPQGDEFVGIADGEMLKINVDSGEWTKLPQKLEAKIMGIAWPNEYASRETGTSKMVVSAVHDGLTKYYSLDIATGKIIKIDDPSGVAKLVTYHPENDVAVFTAELRTGTELELMQDEHRRVLVQANTFLQKVGESERRLIAYRSLNGQDLKAWLILPVGYTEGKRYPLVAYVYAGYVAGDRALYSSLYDDAYLNLQLWSARGYAVLIPSMPLSPNPDGKHILGSDPLMELANGVLPAVDKVIEGGIADPKRLALAGHSYGGYSVYGLVTQTNRFRAAIAMDGYTDLISLYGTFHPSFRYQSYSHEITWEQAVAETSQQRMGNPPWKDLGRYLKNSPIFYVERVETPLLIIQGEFDFPMEQAEEFFTALYRQGKRARLIRYWGDGHILTSPANIRDFWMQTYAWLDEFCDISRDIKGNIIFDGDHAKSRNGAPALKPEDFMRFNDMELKFHPWIDEKADVGYRRPAIRSQ